MISAIFIINSSGNVIISRIFREEVRSGVSEVFRSKIIDTDPKRLKNPILTLGSTTFLHEKQGDIYYVAVTRNNSDASIILQYLSSLITLLQSLISVSPTQVLKDYHLMDNFLLIYELLDLTIDQGFVKDIDASFLLSKIYSPINKATEGKYKSDREVNPKVHIDRKDISLIKDGDIDSLKAFHDKSVVSFHLNEYIQVKGKSDVEVLGELLSVSTIPSNVPVEFQFDTSPAEHSSAFLESMTIPSYVEMKHDSYAEKLNLITSVTKQVQPILNYSANLLFEDLPILAVGSYKQLARDKFEINLKLECRYPSSNIAKRLHLRIPVPQNTTRILDVPLLHHQNLEEEFLNSAQKDGYLHWIIKAVAGEQDLKLCKVVYVDSASKLSDWISSRGTVNVSFQLDNFSVTGYNVKSFNVGESLEDVTNKVVKSCVLSHDIYGFKI